MGNSEGINAFTDISCQSKKGDVKEKRKPIHDYAEQCNGRVGFKVWQGALCMQMQIPANKHCLCHNGLLRNSSRLTDSNRNN